MKINLSGSQPDEEEDFNLFLYFFHHGSEIWRPTNRYRTALVRACAYYMRTKAAPKPWILRCSMQPWLRKLLSPYSFYYN